MSAPDLHQDVAARWLLAMRAGDWDEAWRQTDRIEGPRRAAQASGAFTPQPHHLRWDGTPWAGRVVLVRCLHGLGDTLQFMRFVPLLAREARRLHFLVQPMLLDLLRGAPGLGEVSNAWTDDPPACEVELEVMELAYALRMAPQRLPPPPPLDAALAGRLRVDRTPGVLNAALFWSASEWDPSRSIPLATLAPLLRLPGVRWHHLQQGPAAADPLAAGMVPLHTRTANIADAAAALRQMDLVVTIDGMPAHLAGTLGVPTWLLLKHAADWRWMDARPDSPWYPSLHLVRQQREGDWSGVVEAVARDLAARVVPAQAATQRRPRPDRTPQATGFPPARE